MTADRAGWRLARLGAPLLAFAAPAALVWWALPEGLSWWRSLGIVSAWAATGLALASLALMVRDPRFARLLGGLETAYRWHHRSGLLGYLFLLAHPLALAFDAWEESPGRAWQALAPWSNAWPVWLGWAALLLLMAGLATTFAVHLPYRRWRAFHFLLGAGVLLGLAHVYVLLGGAAPVLGLAALAPLALGWRIFAGDLGVGAHPYRVTEVTRRAANVIEAALAPAASALAVAPGQFVLAAFGEGPHYRGCGEYHPFTVSGLDAGARLRVAVKALGPCSRRLQSLEPGVLVRLQGPFGSYLAEHETGPQLWIAGGIGITPFMASLRAGPRAHPTTLIYLHRRTEDAPFVEELAARAAEDALFELLADASGDALPDFEGLLASVGALAGREVYVCGPPPMVDVLLPHPRARGVPDRSIHFERFDFR